MNKTHGREGSVTFLLSRSEKRALRMLAAESGVLISEYIRGLLYAHTPIAERAQAVEHKIGKLPERETA